MARKLINMKKFYIFIEDSFFSFFVNNINVCYFVGTFGRRNYQHHKAGSDSFKFRRRCQILELFEIRARVSIVYFFSKESYRSAKFSEVKVFIRIISTRNNIFPCLSCNNSKFNKACVEFMPLFRYHERRRNMVENRAIPIFCGQDPRCS